VSSSETTGRGPDSKLRRIRYTSDYSPHNDPAPRARHMRILRRFIESTPMIHNRIPKTTEARVAITTERWRAHCMPGGSSAGCAHQAVLYRKRPLKLRSQPCGGRPKRWNRTARMDVGPANSPSASDAATACGPRVASSPKRPPAAQKRLAQRPRLSILTVPTIPTKPLTTRYRVSVAWHTSHIRGAMDTGCSVTGRPGRSPRELRAVKRPDAPQGHPDDTGYSRYWPGSRRRSVWALRSCAKPGAADARAATDARECSSC